MLNKIISGIVVVLLCNSCGKTSLSPSEYIEWVEDKDHGLSVGKSFDDISYALLYKPSDYIAAKEWENGGLLKETVSQKLKDLGDMQYMTLRITSLNSNELLRAGITNENEYFQRLEYFMDGIQNDIYLIEGKDTLPCILNHFERNYGIAPYNNFVLGFGKTINKEEDKIFVYDDKILGTGKTMIKIESEDINHLPVINWK